MKGRAGAGAGGGGGLNKGDGSDAKAITYQVLEVD